MNAIVQMSTGDAPAQESSINDVELLERFVQTRDQDAFAALVQWHGPMVLGVCRRALGHQQDAEDAFQATFLLLARKASSIRHPERLASWLYGVAYRTSMKLVEQRKRRLELETQSRTPQQIVPPLELAWREVQQALDEEIQNLDGSLRSAIILCYLEGKTHEDAARELGKPVGSMSWLVARALSALRERLARRGLTLTGGMSSLLLALQGPVFVSPELVVATIRSLGALVTTSPLAALVESVLREWSREHVSRLTRVIVLSLLVFLGVGACGYAALTSLSHGDASREQHAPAAGVKCCR